MYNRYMETPALARIPGSSPRAQAAAPPCGTRLPPERRPTGVIRRRSAAGKILGRRPPGRWP